MWMCPMLLLICDQTAAPCGITMDQVISTLSHILILLESIQAVSHISMYYNWSLIGNPGLMKKSSEQKGISFAQLQAESKPYLIAKHAKCLIKTQGPTKKILWQNILAHSSTSSITSSASLSSLTSGLSPSPKATPISSSQQIYQYEHSLSGITGILYEPQSLIPNTAPSLRAFGDKYVQAHGYNESSILCIHNAFEHSDDIDDVTTLITFLREGFPNVKLISFGHLSMDGCDLRFSQNLDRCTSCPTSLTYLLMGMIWIIAVCSPTTSNHVQPNICLL